MLSKPEEETPEYKSTHKRKNTINFLLTGVMLCCHVLIFFSNSTFLEKFFQEYCQSVKQFGPRSGPAKLFAKFIRR